jgi:outer membrane protein
MEQQEKIQQEEKENNTEIKENSEEQIQFSERDTVHANKRRKKICILKIAGYGLVIAAIIFLYVLYFLQPKSLQHNADFLSQARMNSDSKALIVTVNTDSVEKHFILMEILSKDLEKETELYQKELQTKSAAFETKYQNYMINVQNNVLTQTQMQNAERQLLQEKEALEALSSRYTKILVDKETSVHNEIMDSLKNTAKRVNDATYHADYIFAINSGSAVLHANKLFDITDEVIKELNDAYKKSKK